MERERINLKKKIERKKKKRTMVISVHSQQRIGLSNGLVCTERSHRWKDPQQIARFREAKYIAIIFIFDITMGARLEKILVYAIRLFRKLEKSIVLPVYLCFLLWEDFSLSYILSRLSSLVYFYGKRYYYFCVCVCEDGMIYRR